MWYCLHFAWFLPLLLVAACCVFKIRVSSHSKTFFDSSYVCLVVRIFWNAKRRGHDDKRARVVKCLLIHISIFRLVALCCLYCLYWYYDRRLAMWQDWTSARSLESGQILKRRKVSTVSLSSLFWIHNIESRAQSQRQWKTSFWAFYCCTSDKTTTMSKKIIYKSCSKAARGGSKR